MSIFIIAEIGINHNGDIDIAKKLIKLAAEAGADAVKFQKRTIDAVYSNEMLDGPRESPWGTTQRDQKEGLEFGFDEYQNIDEYSKKMGVEWFASAWDIESQHFLRQFDLKYNKVASAMLSHRPLLNAIAEEKKHTFISTGMHDFDEINEAVKIFLNENCSFELMHCCSIYPLTELELINLNVINTLKDKFNCSVGYSGHEVGLGTSIAAAALGISSLERHITLDRSMYGSDQSASIEMNGFKRLINYVRSVEKSMGDGVKVVSDKEKLIREKLAPINVK